MTGYSRRFYPIKIYANSLTSSWVALETDDMGAALKKAGELASAGIEVRIKKETEPTSSFVIRNGLMVSE